ncbi:MAG: S1 RNA-binding domain-containing protein [Planctomycetes bacterium]|nr:S1 RNA-binding domain-containing protein [Planctomycetota bacterium]
MSSKEQQKAANMYTGGGQIDPELQKELDAALGDMSLEDIVDTETPRRSVPAGGEGPKDGLVHGRVIAVQGEDVFVDLGGKSEGVLPALQFGDEALPEVGSVIEVKVTGYNAAEGLVTLSRKGAVEEASWEAIEVGQVVEGRVTALNTGGLELNVNGIRAFMPISQIELHRIDDLAPYVNQRLTAKVLEIRKDSVVIGRRELLEEQAAAARAETMAELTEGQVVTGTVRSIVSYGAFVDIGGVDGLLHVSDMSYSRVEDPATVVQPGQQVQVAILKIDRERDRISLGLKQVKPDPWEGAQTKWVVDDIVSGRVVRLADFGAFVELEEGIDGLIPISELTFERRVKHPSDVVKVGDVVRVRVLKVEPERKRISLSLKKVGDDPWIGAAGRWPADSLVEGTVVRTADFGAFVQLTPGVEGLVHISELSNDHVRAVTDAVRPGDTVKAKVLSVDEDARRISLSIKALSDTVAPAVQEAAPEAPARAVSKRDKPRRGGLEFPGGGLSLGNL